MNHDSHSHAVPEVPPQMLAEHVRAWHGFTRFVLLNCLAVAGLLLFLLLVFKGF